MSGLILLANPRPECWWPALPLFTFHRAASFLGLPRQSLLPEVIIPEAEPEAPFKCGCHVRRCVAESRSGTLEGTMADWTRAQSSGAVEEILDRENKRMADSLASKVTRLKSLALDIDRDTEDQNRYLDGMDSDFTSVTGLLTGSVKRFSTMARSGRDNRKLLCGMAVALIVAFFILSYLLSRTRT